MKMLNAEKILRIVLQGKKNERYLKRFEKEVGKVPGKRYTEEEKQEKLKIIRKAYAEGASIHKAGQEAGVSHQTVRIWLKEDGVRLRGTKNGRGIEYDPEELRELAGEGLTAKEIGKRMHVSKATARLWMRENRIETRAKAGNARKEEKRSRPAERKPEKKCRTCIYRSSNPNHGCNYIGVTGRSRLLICTVSGCTEYRKGKQIRTKEKLADA